MKGMQKDLSTGVANLGRCRPAVLTVVTLALGAAATGAMPVAVQAAAGPIEEIVVTGR